MYIIINLIYKRRQLNIFKYLTLKNERNNMLFILKLVLIFLLIETNAYIAKDVERILLPVWNPTSTKEIPLTLKVFGKQIQLSLRRNDQTVSSKFKIWKHDAQSITEELSQSHASDPYYYVHKDDISNAAINFYQKHGWEGLIFLKDDIWEIRPLRNDFASSSLIDDLCLKEEINISFGKPHLIKRFLQLSADTSFQNLNNFKLKRRHVQNIQKKLTIELAVFFDEAAYRTFMVFLDENKEMLHMMILAFVNNIQAIYHHPSLGVSIDISLVRLEIMDKQPLDLPVFDVERSKLHESFCKYAATHNPSDDNDPDHWDIGLYLTTINSYTNSSEEKAFYDFPSYDVCNPNGSCLIIQFANTATVNMMQSGFESSIFAAHEIGHMLGMLDDSNYTQPCDAFKYIMTSLPSFEGQMTWSECSRRIAEKLWDTKKCFRDRTRPKSLRDTYDHSRYHDLPGRQWTAKAQCEISLLNKDANVISFVDICKSLQCETPVKNYYFIGPALEGTHCAYKKECRGGECVPVIEPPYNFKYCQRDNWSEWKEDTCQSKCLEKSKGVKIRRRSCKHNNYRATNCEGLYYDVVLCNDTLICTNRSARKKIKSITDAKCSEFIDKVNDLNMTLEPEIVLNSGRQAYSVEESWKFCTVLCYYNKNSSTLLITPHVEMLRVRINPFLPDGTWCHNENGQDYYCQRHYCLPENSKNSS